MKKWILIYSVIISLVPIWGSAFTLTVTPTPETCPGNGTLTFNVLNANPAGTITYIVYKLPNTSVPYATLNTNFLNGVSAGNYRVIATETVGSTSTTQQQDTTVNSNVVPFAYTVTNINQACAASSNILITVTSGTGVSYEIFSGPVTFPPQSSNTFSGLPQGTYEIRAYGSCGERLVQIFTVTLNTAGLSISSPVFTNTTPPDCNLTIATNIITPASGTVIGFPLNVQYSVNPPGGGSPIVTNQTINSGNATSQPISETIPYFPNQSYNYDVSVTDACGTFVTDNFNVTNNITLNTVIISSGCNTFHFSVTAGNFTPPFSLNFTNAPAGFNPASFNSVYPGPYSAAAVIFGSNSNPAPFGNYTVDVTDACGKSVSRNFSFLSNPPIPQAEASHNGCLTSSEKIVVKIINYTIATATVTSAPASYPFPLPHDVSAFLDSNGILTLDPVPLGAYSFVVTDTCNSILTPVNVLEPIYTDQGLSSNLRPGCSLLKSSIKINSNNGDLTSLLIVSAPSAFPQTLPYNATSNITGGVFYLDDLPPGTYIFDAIDVCNFPNSITVNVVGYAITTSTFSLQHNCGSFDIDLDFVSNGTANQSFWLQKLLDPTSNTWGSPSAPASAYLPGDVYTPNTIPNNNNSFQLANNATNFNLSFNGTFRIMRRFSSYNNGSDVNNAVVSSVNHECLDPLAPLLSFNEALEILNAYSMPCSASGLPDIIISALGTPPLHYTITTKDGLPFFLDNGTSNIFVNLPPGLYTFNVEDPCANLVPKIFNTASLISLVNITQPADLLNCVTVISGNETFDLTSQSATILGPQLPADYTLTYYTTINDAQSATNPITNLTTFNPSTNPQSIYARLIFNQLPNCYQTAAFELLTGITPTISLLPDYLACTTTPVTLDATGSNLSTTTYLWSDGSTNPIITITQPGITNLTITASNTYGTNGGVCTSTQDITITISQFPTIDHIDTTDWTADENTITIISANPAAFDYSLDNVNYQSSNEFTNLAPGVYTVYIRDINGCGILQQTVWLLNYPKFFTPNNDGFNEYWLIPNQSLEPDFQVYIYDRYGKMLNFFTSQDRGWDGNYNNRPLFADDYWFVVQRQDGRILKGHFTLKR